MKRTTKTLTEIITSLINISDGQGKFRTGTFGKDAVFKMKEIERKSFDYDKLTFGYFVDLEKIFDRVELKDMIHLLSSKGL